MQSFVRDDEVLHFLGFEARRPLYTDAKVKNTIQIILPAVY